MCGELVGYSEITTGYGYASGHVPSAHFGLGKVKEVDVQVRTPGGKVVKRRAVAKDQVLVVEVP